MTAPWLVGEETSVYADGPAWPGPEGSSRGDGQEWGTLLRAGAAGDATQEGGLGGFAAKTTKRRELGRESLFTVLAGAKKGSMYTVLTYTQC